VIGDLGALVHLVPDAPHHLALPLDGGAEGSPGLHRGHTLHSMRGTQVVAHGSRVTGEQGVLTVPSCLGLVVATDKILANLPGSSSGGGEAGA
jgi:hypothetical protein